MISRLCWSRAGLGGMALALLMFAASLPVASAGDYESLMSGEVAAARVKRVVAEIDWKRDMESALSVAKEQNKPLLWLQLVGELDDGL